jgi:hypothetical protein
MRLAYVHQEIHRNLHMVGGGDGDDGDDDGDGGAAAAIAVVVAVVAVAAAAVVVVVVMVEERKVSSCGKGAGSYSFWVWDPAIELLSTWHGQLDNGDVYAAYVHARSMLLSSIVLSIGIGLIHSWEWDDNRGAKNHCPE